MGHCQFDSLGRIIRPVHRKSLYALEVLPKYAKAGGAAWASDFAASSFEEQRAIVLRMVTAKIRAEARRHGRPDPVILEAKVKPLDGGGFILNSTAPLPFKHGGDGRTLKDALREAKRPVYRDAPLKLLQEVERHTAMLAEMGIEVVVETPEPEPPCERKAKRCASR